MADFEENEDFLPEEDELGGDAGGGQSGKGKDKEKDKGHAQDKGKQVTKEAKAGETAAGGFLKGFVRGLIPGLLSAVLIILFVIVVIGAVIAIFARVSGADVSTNGGGGFGSCADQPRSVPMNTSTNTFNFTPHGRSLSSPPDNSGHNTILRKSQNYGAENVKNSLGEAVDVYDTPGTPVLAPFNGDIIHSADIGFGTGDFIIVESADKCLVAALAHLTPGQHPTGGEVTAGQVVGNICACLRQPHLHFELWADGEPINIGGPINGYNSSHSKRIWEKQKEFLER